MIEAVPVRQDTLNCMVLSEAVYKAVDFGDAGAADMLAAIVRSFPPALLGIQRVQWAQPHSHHRRVTSASHCMLCWGRFGVRNIQQEAAFAFACIADRTGTTCVLLHALPRWEPMQGLVPALVTAHGGGRCVYGHVRAHQRCPEGLPCKMACASIEHTVTLSVGCEG